MSRKRPEIFVETTPVECDEFFQAVFGIAIDGITLGHLPEIDDVHGRAHFLSERNTTTRKGRKRRRSVSNMEAKATADPIVLVFIRSRPASLLQTEECVR